MKKRFFSATGINDVIVFDKVESVVPEYDNATSALQVHMVSGSVLKISAEYANGFLGDFLFWLGDKDV